MRVCAQCIICFEAKAGSATEESVLCALCPEEINSPAYNLLGETTDEQDG